MGKKKGKLTEADYERRELLIRNAENLRRIVIEHSARLAANAGQQPQSSDESPNP